MSKWVSNTGLARFLSDLKTYLSNNYRASTWTPSKSDVGLGSVDNVKQYSASNPPPDHVLVLDSKNTTVTTDSTKGVSPYSTSYGYTNFTVSGSKSWVEGMIVIIMPTAAVASANRNGRVRLGTSGTYIPIMGSGGSILNSYSYLTANSARAFSYSTAYVSTGALHLLSDSNSDVYLRVYRSNLASGGTYDANYPILVSRTKDTGITADSYAAVYGQINSDTEKVAYINPTTGEITAPNYKGKVNGYTIEKSVPSDAKFTDTTYESKSAASGGTAVSLVTTGEKYTWNNKGTYSKPSGGIPKTDLASAVQTSLGKADSALQDADVIALTNAEIDTAFDNAT